MLKIDENKLDVIGKYFAKSYKLKKTNEDFLNVLLTKIKETDNLEKLNNLSLLLEDEFYFMDTWLYENKENILKIMREVFRITGNTFLLI